ncbi:MAG: glycosyltransferase family 4 protein [Candidatus Moranbacteria bacterium]|nr:glycosyltransferase family 4 protein [Candidatus Moranbacteria bacterium]
MKRLMDTARRVARELRKNDLRDFTRKAWFYSFGKGRMLWALDPDDWKRKKAKAAVYFSKYPVGNGGERPNIVFIVPGTWISGGIAVILRHANLLKTRGYDVTIVTQDLKASFPWYAGQDVPVVPIDRVWALLGKGIDILVATGWNSAPTVDLLPAKRKIYFVQLDERRFYDDEATKNFVGETYRLSFEYVVMARWMQEWLRDEFGHEAAYVPNGLDTDRFRPTDPVEPKDVRPRVLIEGPIDIPFKGVADAYEAVKDLDCDIWMVSSRGTPPQEWRCERFFESVPIDDMPGIYSSCDILLKMSTVESFAYPPLEMMACGGVPVILRVSGIEEYAEHDRNCLIIETKEEARAAVEKLLDDADLRGRLSENGLKTAKEWSWDRSAEAMRKVIAG